MQFSNKILDWEDQTRVLRGEDLKQAKCERRTAYVYDNLISGPLLTCPCS